MKETPITISDAEWEVMRTVWANGSVTSKKAVDILTNKNGWKEATIKTLLGRLVGKEALVTETNGRKFIYSAAVTEEELMDTYIEDILSRVCNRLAEKSISKMISKVSLSHEDIDKLKKCLREKALTSVDEVSCECIDGQCACHLHSH